MEIAPRPPSEEAPPFPKCSRPPAGRLWRIRSQVRSVTDTNGALVFDIDSSRFHSLNSTGTVVWETLKQNPNGVDSAQILHAMKLAFGSHPQMADDLDELMRSLEQKNLVQSDPNGLVTNESSITISNSRRQLQSDDGIAILGKMPDALAPSTGPSNPGGSALRTFAAWLCFGAVTFILWAGGFSRLHRVLRWLSAKRPVGVPCKDKVADVCVAVNKAATYYLRTSWCLHRAAVTFSLLRIAGIPAELVIGCQRVPFYSHAWVEIGGTVINDNPGVKARYAELERL